MAINKKKEADELISVNIDTSDSPTRKKKKNIVRIGIFSRWDFTSTRLNELFRADNKTLDHYHMLMDCPKTKPTRFNRWLVKKKNIIVQ